MLLRSTVASVRNPCTKPSLLVAASAPSGRPAHCHSELRLLRRQLPVSASQQPADQWPGPRQGDTAQEPAAKDVAAASDARLRQRSAKTAASRQDHFGLSAEPRRQCVRRCGRQGEWCPTARKYCGCRLLLAFTVAQAHTATFPTYRVAVAGGHSHACALARPGQALRASVHRHDGNASL